MNKKQMLVAFISASVILIGAMLASKAGSSYGPISAELLAYEYSKEAQEKTAGLFDAKIDIISTNRLAPDLVEYTVNLTLVRTAKPVPVQLYAKMKLFKDKKMEQLLRQKPGASLPSETKKITYKKTGDAWKRTE